MTFDGKPVELIRKSIKCMHLYVLPPDGRLRVTAPCRTPESAIEEFLASKAGWVRKHAERLASQPPAAEPAYETGEDVYFWGARYRLEARESADAWAELARAMAPPPERPAARDGARMRAAGTRRAAVWTRGGEAVVLCAWPGAAAKDRAAVLNLWYKGQVLAACRRYFAKWEPLLGVAAEDVRVRFMKTRWGTCNYRQKRVWLNLQLAKKPPECLEYIVVHELAHLIEKSHNERFRAVMDSHLPGWRAIKKQLNAQAQ
jgi:predicted metal-dependent hydrolase